MSELVVLGFKNEQRADEVMLTLSKLNKSNILELEDSAVVIRDSKGDIHIKHKNQMATLTHFINNFWGLLVASLFYNPLSALGAKPAAAISNKLLQLEVREEFIRDLTQLMQPGSSALFLLMVKDARKVQETLNIRDGRILHTPISKNEVQKVRTQAEREMAGTTR